MNPLLKNILNNKRKPVKVIGTIVDSPSYLKYVINTDTGRMLVESTIPYKLSDRVVVYDNLIQGYAGAEQQRKSILV